MSAVLTGKVELVKLLLNHPTKKSSNFSELNSTDFLGNTPLMISAAHGYSAVGAVEQHAQRCNGQPR